MYNLYINTTASENKGSFTIPYTHRPLYFATGSKIAFNNALIYNSIYNISAVRGNNEIYILAGKHDGSDFEEQLPHISSSRATGHGSEVDGEWVGFFKTTRAQSGTGASLASKDVPSYADVFGQNVNGGTHKLYKIVLPDGQYSIESLDEAIARRLGIDIDTTSASNIYNVVKDDERKFMLEAEPTYNKVRILSDAHISGTTKTLVYDIVYPVSGDVDKSIMKFLGLNYKNATDRLDTKSLIATNDYYSFNDTAEDNNGTSTLAFLPADVNNGMTSVNIRIKGGLYNGGFDSNSHESDILHSFNLTAEPGYPQSIEPTNLVFLDITAVNTYIDRLKFAFTDQDGHELNTNMSENSSIVITIREPTD
tara:strand:- start:806 stop:1903 length:1098 start_codon:yes stop_codon:yes gene_type:complete